MELCIVVLEPRGGATAVRSRSGRRLARAGGDDARGGAGSRPPHARGGGTAHAPTGSGGPRARSAGPRSPSDMAASTSLSSPFAARPRATRRGLLVALLRPPRRHARYFGGAHRLQGISFLCGPSASAPSQAKVWTTHSSLLSSAPGPAPRRRPGRGWYCAASKRR